MHVTLKRFLALAIVSHVRGAKNDADVDENIVDKQVKGVVSEVVEEKEEDTEAEERTEKKQPVKTEDLATEESNESKQKATKSVKAVTADPSKLRSKLIATENDIGVPEDEPKVTTRISTIQPTSAVTESEVTTEISPFPITPLSSGTELKTLQDFQEPKLARAANGTRGRTNLAQGRGGSAAESVPAEKTVPPVINVPEEVVEEETIPNEEVVEEETTPDEEEVEEKTTHDTDSDAAAKKDSGTPKVTENVVDNTVSTKVTQDQSSKITETAQVKPSANKASGTSSGGNGGNDNNQVARALNQEAEIEDDLTLTDDNVEVSEQGEGNELDGGETEIPSLGSEPQSDVFTDRPMLTLDSAPFDDSTEDAGLASSNFEDSDGQLSEADALDSGGSERSATFGSPGLVPDNRTSGTSDSVQSMTEMGGIIFIVGIILALVVSVLLAIFLHKRYKAKKAAANWKQTRDLEKEGSMYSGGSIQDQSIQSSMQSSIPGSPASPPFVFALDLDDVSTMSYSSPMKIADKKASFMSSIWTLKRNVWWRSTLLSYEKSPPPSPFHGQEMEGSHEC